MPVRVMLPSVPGLNVQSVFPFNKNVRFSFFLLGAVPCYSEEALKEDLIIRINTTALNA